MTNKELCQFYTTNSDIILKNMYIFKESNVIIEPFCGNKDMINFFNIDCKLELYDIDPKNEDIKKRDTLLEPPDYKDKFIITNPPFRNKNKNSKNQEIYNLYKSDDLYKCFILSFLDKNPIGGIIILPLNFISSIRKNDIELRKKFIEKFDIILINIFEEQVFEDTSYNICSILFQRKKENKDFTIKLDFYPSLKKMELVLNKNNNYTIGGEIYNLSTSSKYTVNRGVKNKTDGITNIIMHCIDSSKKIHLFFEENNIKYIDNTVNLTMRTYGVLCINPDINIEVQKNIIEKFNYFLDNHRDKYNSLFLTNYRDKYRKRISFELVFHIIKHLLLDYE